jgi:hypothetical protein
MSSTKLATSWIALACSLLLLAAILFVVTREHNFDALVDVWSRTEPGPFAFAVVAMIALQSTAAWRLEVIMGAEGLHRIGFWPLLRIQLVSQFVANGAPISALSDLAKAAMVKLRFDLGMAQSIRLVLYERICGALGAIIVGVFAVLGQLVVPTPSGLVKAQALLWAAGCAGIAALIAIGGGHISTKVKFLDRVTRAITGLGHILRRPTIAAKLLLATVAMLFGFAIVFIELARGMQVQVSVPHVFLFMPLIFFVSALPVFYQGWGGREAAVVATIGSTAQVTSPEAIALSVAFGIVVFLASLPGAVFWIMRPSMRKGVRTEVEQG